MVMRCASLRRAAIPIHWGAQVRSPNSIVIGSGDFPESQTIAEIYAQTLQANGFEVGKRMGIGSRETYIPALKDHSIDLVPEYIGNLLLYICAAVQRHHVGCRRAGARPAPAPRPCNSDARPGRRHRYGQRDRTNGELLEPEGDRRFGRPLGRRAIRGALGLRDPAGRACRDCSRSMDSTSGRATSSPSTTAAVRSPCAR